MVNPLSARTYERAPARVKLPVWIAAVLVAGSAAAQAPPRGSPGRSAGAIIFGQPAGAPLFRAHCGNCHTQAGLDIGGAAPTLSSLKAMSPEFIYAAVARGGKMEQQAAALTDRDKRNVIEFLTGRAVGDENPSPPKMTNQCASNPPLPARLDSTPDWDGWSPQVTNTRFQTAEFAGLKASDIPNLKLKWAFGLPGGGSAASQPTIAFGRVFVGSDNAEVYSFNAKSGCFYWSFIADSPGRFAPVIGPISGHPGSRFAIYFPTGSGMTYALDAQSGKLLWKTPIEGLLHISNSAALYDGKLFVPIAGTETMSGANPNYECCRSRGGLAAFDANTGKILWKVDSIPEPLKQLGENPKGKQLWGPAGASVWNTPTIDAKRKRVYVGTGNNYGPLPATTSDSILAFDMAEGKLVWSHQEFHGDSFMVGCGPTNPAGGNCPTKLGPDWDFGGSSAILERLPNGKDVLLAAGKGGVAIALDPDDDGKLLWRTQLWEKTPPSPMGLVLFGGTADGERVYYPLQEPGGGLKALDVTTGKIVWDAAINADQRGQPGAATSIPGVVFTGGWDGILRAVGTTGADDGKVIWSYDTHRDYNTINGIRANGGSLGPPGVTIAAGMVYVSSGYIGVQNGFPGNVVLAFALD